MWVKLEKINIFKCSVVFKNNTLYIITRLKTINYIVDNIINCVINSIKILIGALFRNIFSKSLLRSKKIDFSDFLKRDSLIL